MCISCTLACMQVVMTQWTNPEPADWSQHASRLHQLWHNQKWSNSIYIDDRQTQAPDQQTSAPPTALHSRLQHIAAKACGVCDPDGHRSFPSDAALMKHVTKQHGLHMCAVCLNVSPPWFLHLLANCSPRSLGLE